MYRKWVCTVRNSGDERVNHFLPIEIWEVERMERIPTEKTPEMNGHELDNCFTWRRYQVPRASSCYIRGI